MSASTTATTMPRRAARVGHSVHCSESTGHGLTVLVMPDALELRWWQCSDCDLVGRGPFFVCAGVGLLPDVLAAERGCQNVTVCALPRSNHLLQQLRWV